MNNDDWESWICSWTADSMPNANAFTYPTCPCQSNNGTTVDVSPWDLFPSEETSNPLEEGQVDRGGTEVCTDPVQEALQRISQQLDAVIQESFSPMTFPSEC